MRPTAMLCSPAYEVLHSSERRMLERIEIELAKHGGKDNGKLPVTHEQFREFRVHRNYVGPGLRALCALGFVEITERGVAAPGTLRSPTLLRLTYRRTKNAPATDEWRRINTIEEAQMIASKARADKPDHYTIRKRKRKNHTRKLRSQSLQKRVSVTDTGKTPFPVSVTDTHAPNSPVSVTETTSRYLATPLGRLGHPRCVGCVPAPVALPPALERCRLTTPSCSCSGGDRELG